MATNLTKFYQKYLAAGGEKIENHMDLVKLSILNKYHQSQCCKNHMKTHKQFKNRQASIARTIRKVYDKTI